MYAATIGLYHSEFGKNPGRISKKLDILVHSFNWQDMILTGMIFPHPIKIFQPLRC